MKIQGKSRDSCHIVPSLRKKIAFIDKFDVINVLITSETEMSDDERLASCRSLKPN